MDETNLLDRVVRLLEAQGVRYCVIGGLAVNAYVDPLVSLDLDLVVAAEQLGEIEPLLAAAFTLRRFPHCINIAAPGSDLRVQIQTDPRYASFVERATRMRVLGLDLPVAAIADVLAGKVWAAQDPARRPSKRQKDLADIARLIEAYPEMREMVPDGILERLV